MQGKAILVTGAAQGIGRQIALDLAQGGAEILILVDRQRERGEAVMAEIQALGAEAGFILADLAEADAPARVIDQALARFGRIDILVNAAAVTDRAAVATVSPAVWDRVFAVNARAPTFLMQAVIQHLKERQAPGTILNILSVNAAGGTPELAIYAASKAALSLLTRNAAHAHRFDRIRINGINPGWVDTPAERQMQSVTLGQGDGWLSEAAARQPIGRLLLPEDVARLALFLLGDASFPMTGSLVDLEQYVLSVRD
jgi:NAD(P)-dependent dehydrogenase (short-subunit alcohol dehydrogenase family)